MQDLDIILEGVIDCLLHEGITNQAMQLLI